MPFFVHEQKCGGILGARKVDEMRMKGSGKHVAWWIVDDRIMESMLRRYGHMMRMNDRGTVKIFFNMLVLEAARLI